LIVEGAKEICVGWNFNGQKGREGKGRGRENQKAPPIKRSLLVINNYF